MGSAALRGPFEGAPEGSRGLQRTGPGRGESQAGLGRPSESLILPPDRRPRVQRLGSGRGAVAPRRSARAPTRDRRLRSGGCLPALCALLVARVDAAGVRGGRPEVHPLRLTPPLDRGDHAARDPRAHPRTPRSRERGAAPGPAQGTAAARALVGGCLRQGASWSRDLTGRTVLPRAGELGARRA